MNHGGKRAGAGRPRKAEVRILVNFTLSRETVGLLRREIAARHRSMFVEDAIAVALRRIGSSARMQSVLKIGE